MNKLRSAMKWIVFLFALTIWTGLAVASSDQVQSGTAGQSPAPAAASIPTTAQTAPSSQMGQNTPPPSQAPAAAPAGANTDPAAASTNAPKTTDPTLQDLEQQIIELDRRLKAAEANEPARPAAAPDTPPAGVLTTPNNTVVIADHTGFLIRSGDGNFALRIGADLQLDTRMFFGTGATGVVDNTLLRRVRPIISGTVFKYVDYFFRPDFGQGTTVIYDAYVELKYFEHFKLRVGKFKPAVGLERLQSDDDTTFVERGLPTLLVPSRDIGFQIAGDFLNNRATYAVGVFNGVPDNGLSDAAVSDHRDYSARLFLSPFQPDHNVLSGLGFGMGSSFGNVDGEALPAYKSFGQNSVLPFASGVTEAGHRTRLAPGMYYYLGPFGLYAEDGVTEEGLQKGTVRRDIAFRAWQVAASYVLTGEKKNFGSPSPKRVFDPKNGGWGAFELAVRVGEFRAEPGLYNYGFATATTAPRLMHEVVGGVNWYLNELFRISADYGHTTFEDGATAAAGFNRPTEDALIFRFQIDFVRTSQSWAYRGQ
jgi:phosphate-selective porin OprO/OprP